MRLINLDRRKKSGLSIDKKRREFLAEDEVKFRKKLLLFPLFFFLQFSDSLAVSTAISLPKFMSLKVAEANVRSGPGTQFPVKWILVEKSIPLEVIDSFDNWYKIRDEEEMEGWVHKSLMTGQRYFVIDKDNASLYRSPKYNLITFNLEAGVRGKIKSCRSDWCEILVGDYSGWIHKDDIWGVYPDENF